MRGLSIALTWLLAVSALVTLLMTGLYVDHRSLLNGVRDGHFLSYADAHAADRRVASGAGLGLLVGLAVFVVLIVFLYRASKNTELWDPQPRKFSAGWTIGGWFIPIASFIIPFMVVAEIWKRSPERDAYGVMHRVAAAPVGIWWVAWLVGNFGFVLARNNSTETLDTLIQHDAFRIVASLALFLGSLVLLVVVRQINARQMRLAAMAPTTPPPPAPPPAGDFMRV